MYKACPHAGLGMMRRAPRWLANLAFSCTALLGGTSLAAPGDLDNAFGVAGTVDIDVGYSSREGTAVAAQSDGKYLVSGVAWGWETFGSPLFRFNADHTLDTTYGYQGKAENFGIRTATKVVAGDKAMVAENVWLWAQDPVSFIFYQDVLLARYDSNGIADPTFGTNGRTPTFNAGTGGNQRFNDFSIAPDGKLVAAGWTSSTSGNTKLLVVRYTAAGALDTGFGTGGYFTFDVPSIGASYQELRGVTVLADGRILAVGYAGSPHRGIVVLINAAGTAIDNYLAPSFYVDSSGNTECNAITTVSASRSVVACMEGSTSAGLIFAVDASGNIDTGFNGGPATYSLGGGASAFRGLAIAGDGKIYAVGYGNGGARLAVMAFASDGTTDTGFASSGAYVMPESEFSRGAGAGIVGTELVATGTRGGPDSDIAIATFTRATGVRTSVNYYKSTTSTEFAGVIVLADGRIMLGGTTGLGNTPNFVVTRLLSSGAIDASYGVSGYSMLAVPTMGANVGVRDMVMQVDGMALVTGAFNDFGDHLVGVARLAPSGTGDPAFNAGGTPGYNYVDTGPVNGAHTFSRSVRLQADGKIVALGSGNPGTRQIAVARFNSNGTVDSSYGTAGVAMSSFGSNTTGRALDMGADGKVVATGSNGNQLRVVRFTTTGAFDTSFGSSGASVFNLPAGYTLQLPNRIFVLADGSILVLASVNSPTGCGPMAVKLKSDGSLDDTYGAGLGWGYFDAISGPGALCNWFHGTVAPGGKLIGVGYTQSNATRHRGSVVRINADGTADNSFGTGGVVSYVYSDGVQEFGGVSVAVDGSMVLSGNFNPYSGGRFGRIMKTVADASTLVPSPPRLLSVTPGSGQATVTFSPSQFAGASAVSNYTVTCNPGGITASGSSSPIVVSGLTNGVTYTCSVTATNASGVGESSPASVSFTTGALPNVDISTTQTHTLALNAAGTVFAWGSDSYGQLGQSRSINRASPQQVVGLPAVSQVAIASHVLAIDTFKQVWSWGDNSCGGQLGPRESSVTSQPGRVIGAINATRVAAGGCFSVAVKSDGTVMGWGDIAGYGTDTSLRILGGLNGIVEIAAGPTHVVALASGGTVYAFGENAGGVLGVGSGAGSSAAALVQGLANVTAVAAGHEASLAVGNGQVYFWGKHANGTIVSVPAALPAIGGSALSISFSDRVPVVVRGDGAVLAYDVASNAWQAPSGYSAIAKIAPSALNFSLAIGANGQLYASGENTAGQLGQGDTNVHAGVISVPGFANTSMVAASNLTPSVIALKGDGSAWFWGADTVGQSGDSAAIGSSVPRQVTIGGSIKAIATGATFSAALDTAGNVWGWGDNRKGPLGASLVGRSAPALIAGLSNVQAIAAGGDGLMLYIMADGSVRAGGSLPPSFTGIDPTPVSGLSSIIAIAAGSSAYALRSDGVLFAWGDNSSGELGNGTTTPSSAPVVVQGISGVITRIAAGEHRAAAVTSDGKVWAWGAAIAGTFGGSTTAQVVPGIADASDVSVGSTAIFVRRQGGGMYAWGTSGLADQAGQNLAQPYPIAFYQSVNSIIAGARNALGFVVGNTGVAWGFGTYGDVSTSSPAIGDGAYVPRDRPVVVLAAGGTGSVDGNDWYLDLDTSSPETIPAGSTPKALGVSRLFGSDAGLSLDATVKYKSADYGKPVNNYVFALVPPSFIAAVATTQAAKMRAKGMAKDDVSVLAQLTPSGWSFVDSQLLAYSQSTASSAGSSVNILNSVDSTQIPGGRFCIGYGESSGSMLTFEALREVLLLPGASSNLSGVPCILTGLYVDGPASSRVGSAATFTGSVVGLSPTGAVQFTDSNGSIGGPMPLTGQSQAVGAASISISSLALGVHSIGGLYAGDSKNAAASSQVPVSHLVVEAPPGGSSTTLNGPVSSDLGSLATFTALVAGDSPTGTVQFKDGGNNLGDAVPLVGGQATLRTAALALGGHSITGNYSGNGSNTPSTSNTITHTVYAAITTQVSLATIVNPNGSVTMSATVTGNVTPTGTVFFRDGGATLAQSGLANGTASYTATNLAPGTHEFYADYSGDANNQAVTSGAVVQQVSLPHSLLNSPRLLNISTRGQVQTGFNVMIGGFVISGPTSKRVVIRAIGPSLVNYGVQGALANPQMQIVHSDNNMLIASNDDWGSADNAADLQRSGFAPSNAAESALLVTLAPGAYTAIVSGVGDVTGVGLVEVYEVDHPEVSLINISTRGKVGTGFDVMIGGFVITGDGPQTVVIRAIGPSLANYGVAGSLANPQLQLVRQSDQSIMATNDDWGSDPNAAQVQSSGFAPSNPLESAIYITLDPGAYTAIVSGVNNTSGVGLVEVYKVGQ